MSRWWSIFSRFGNLDRSFKKLHNTIYLKYEGFWVSLKQLFSRSIAQTAIFVMHIQYLIHSMVSGCCVFSSFIISFIFFLSGIIQMHAINLIASSGKTKTTWNKNQLWNSCNRGRKWQHIHSTLRLKRRKSDDFIVAKCIICNKKYNNKIKKSVPSLWGGKSRVVYESYKI